MATKKKFAAMLLFQFRAVRGGTSNKRRVCEERIVIINAPSPLLAVKGANAIGKRNEFSYVDDGVKVLFEFVGVRDLVELDDPTEPNEVWSRMVELVSPMERRSQLIPSPRSLSALREGKRRLLVPPASMRKRPVKRG